MVVRIDVHVDEIAQLLRKKAQPIYARIWDGKGAGGLGMLPREGFGSVLQTHVLEAIEVFLNDYLAANPPH